MGEKAKKITGIEPLRSKWRTHELVTRRTFFTLPTDLLAAVKHRVRWEKFDRVLWELEEQIGTEASQDAGVVGYNDCQPIFYPYLSERNPDSEVVSSADVKWMGWTEQQADDVNSASGFLASQHNQKMSYCGWLMSKPRFRIEQRAVLESHARCFELGPPIFIRHEKVEESEVRGDQLAALEQWQLFYARWRLNKLVAPGLPDPVGAQWADLGRDFTPAHLRESTRGPRMSDTQMLPDAETLRSLMKESRADDADKHLRDWKRLIDPSNPSKVQQIARYARIFRLQHYWKVLYSRHGISLKGERGRLELAFADYLDIDVSSIHSDCQLLRDQLGHYWFTA